MEDGESSLPRSSSYIPKCSAIEEDKSMVGLRGIKSTSLSDRMLPVGGTLYTWYGIGDTAKVTINNAGCLDEYHQLVGAAIYMSPSKSSSSVMDHPAMTGNSPHLRRGSNRCRRKGGHNCHHVAAGPSREEQASMAKTSNKVGPSRPPRAYSSKPSTKTRRASTCYISPMTLARAKAIVRVTPTPKVLLMRAVQVAKEKISKLIDALSKLYPVGDKPKGEIYGRAVTMDLSCPTPKVLLMRALQVANENISKLMAALSKLFPVQGEAQGGDVWACCDCDYGYFLPTWRD